MKTAPLAFACGAVAFCAQAEPLWPCWPRLGSEVISEFHPPANNDGFHVKIRPRNPDDPMPRGGSYVQADAVSNLHRDSPDVLRVFLFDPGCDSLVLDGQPLSDATLPPGVIIAESGNSMILKLPQGGAVVLRGIRPALWRQGSLGQIHGTAGNDTLPGSAGDDVMSSGSGADIVSPGDGNDSVVYGTGDLTISNQPENLGTDVLDLRRFAIEGLGFAEDGDDLVITTADGVIRLQGQLQDSGNIEVILLTEGQNVTAAKVLELIGQ